MCAQADVWQRLSWLSRPRSVCLTRRGALDLGALVEQRAEGAEQLDGYEL